MYRFWRLGYKAKKIAEELGISVEEAHEQFNSFMKEYYRTSCTRPTTAD